MYEPEIERANGLPITVTCTNSTSNTEASRKAALIEFDYELAIVNPNEHLAEFMKQDLPSLEFFLLFYVADEAGLLECNLERQVIAPTQTGAAGDVSAISGIDLERLNVDIVSLSSTSTDTRDLTVESCQYLVNIDPSLICVPLKGTMKATFIGDETAMSAVTSYLSYHIEQVINSSKIQQNGIEQALYLGSRYIPVAASPPPLISAGSSKEANNSNGSSVALASTFSVLVVLLVVLAVFAMVRRKRQQPPDKVETIPPLDDLEKQQVLVTGGGNDSGAVQHPPSIVTVSKSLASGEFNDESSDQAMAGGGFLESVHNVGQQYDDNEVPSSSPPYPMSSAYSITTARTSSTTKDSSVGESFGLEDDITEKIANVKPMDVKVVDVEVPSSVPPSVVDILPPKHPAGSSQKPPVPSVVGSKRRKKKKKKKKKLALVRSSSRENVSEMETIAEGEEETSGDMDDDGSEYSWCSTSDSDPGSNPGSRDPSPSRSREPSPSRPGSDGANLTPVPSLSWDYSNIGLAATSSDGEQNKANRLPPKWI